jgi:hypothetical protein
VRRPRPRPAEGLVDVLVAGRTQVVPLAQAADQMAWHRKPAGWAGAPCPVCGCPSPRLLAWHRALPAEESWRWKGHGGPVLWIKRVKVCFGTDFTEVGLLGDGSTTDQATGGARSRR